MKNVKNHSKIVNAIKLMNIFFARGNQNIDIGPQGQLIPKKLFHPPPPPAGHQVGPLDTTCTHPSRTRHRINPPITLDTPQSTSVGPSPVWSLATSDISPASSQSSLTPSFDRLALGRGQGHPHKSCSHQHMMNTPWKVQKKSRTCGSDVNQQNSGGTIN